MSRESASDAGARWPIFVTGSHRSGTTWTAEVLSRGGNIELVDEPFNISYRPRRVKRPFPYWFQYITAENESEFVGELDFVFSLRYPIVQVLQASQWDQVSEYGRQLVSTVKARRYHRRVLCKDPIGVFSAPWIHDRYHCHIIICVRHPAAFASSLVRLGWAFDFSNWLEQPLFMKDCAGPYAESIEEYATKPPALIDQAILLWKVIYRRVQVYRDLFPDWCVIRHEDLASDPMGVFPKLYQSCGLEFGTAARQFIASTTSSNNPIEVPPEDCKVVTRNSAKMARIWKTRLTAEEVSHVRARTEREASRFYSSADWALSED